MVPGIAHIWPSYDPHWIRFSPKNHPNIARNVAQMFPHFSPKRIPQNNNHAGIEHQIYLSLFILIDNNDTHEYIYK